MNVVVFGATGSTGRLVVESALSAGHAVTAFVRDPKRMPLTHPSLRIAKGDAMDPASVASAVQGTDAVICTLGAIPQAKGDRGRRQPGVPVCSVGTRNILAAMPRGRGRLIVENSVSVGESYHTGSFGAGFLVKLALRKVMADKEEQEAAVRKSDCDWTIVRPATLTFKPARGNLKAGTDLRWNITSTATRADVAEYMVKILDDPATYKKAITLRN
ncbi:NAD(P)-dependent oxidoreductase [Bradyrhizobium sp. AUGA SZCCT0431]|uniref:NAD(P)-dependent oxidoreductase n=1 Tax=Bradyrhizobium sp. AUGA SZCCT0431 TaxID=2807674 RepID=UPI001BA53119|nr:NAD(P)-binding oxidoreductase [Bradyrhizobium sp. AUGA SZCCT0431]MBR1147686.1 NAD(P)H-binding protein [Bradyrhizobium sp. AUGA SZCCT0431]